MKNFDPALTLFLLVAQNADSQRLVLIRSSPYRVIQGAAFVAASLLSKGFHRGKKWQDLAQKSYFALTLL